MKNECEYHLKGTGGGFLSFLADMELFLCFDVPSPPYPILSSTSTHCREPEENVKADWKQNFPFPLGPVIKYSVLPPDSKIQKKREKMRKE